MVTTNGSPEKAAALPPRQPMRKGHRLLLIAGVAGLVILALALGLGLGLGLRHPKGSGDSQQSAAAPSPSGTPLPGAGGSGSTALEDWRLDTSQYVLDTSWDLNAKPTTRNFDLVITEGQGWPDGEPRDSRDRDSVGPR